VPKHLSELLGSALRQPCNSGCDVWSELSGRRRYIQGPHPSASSMTSIMRPVPSRTGAGSGHRVPGTGIGVGVVQAAAVSMWRPAAIVGLSPSSEMTARCAESGVRLTRRISAALIDPR